MAAAIVAAKARGAWAVWGDLGAELAAAVGERRLLPVPEAVTWIPAAPDRIRSRGVDHAERLAAPVAVALGIPLVGLLAAVPRRRDQTDLPLADRRRLDSAAFRAIEPPPERTLLVDDVLTTGATIDVAARALARTGAGSVTVAVLARAGNHRLGTDLAFNRWPKPTSTDRLDEPAQTRGRTAESG
ncbi:MAG: ComF family protein [Nitriliruptorales bacterium]